MKRAIYKPLGALFLALGLAGILLPILPTTPFVLLAAWFFARSSEQWHARLVQSELFGPTIRNWETHRCVARRTKIVALSTMAFVGGTSLTLLIDATSVKMVTAGLLIIGAGTVLSLRTCPQCQDKTVAPSDRATPELSEPERHEKKGA